jgi:hypothetical protein
MIEIGIAALIGATLALKFQAFILFPANLIGIATTIATGVFTGIGVWWIVLDTVIVATSLQFGYLVGAAVIFMPSLAQAEHHSCEQS